MANKKKKNMKTNLTEGTTTNTTEVTTNTTEVTENTTEVTENTTDEKENKEMGTENTTVTEGTENTTVDTETTVDTTEGTKVTFGKIKSFEKLDEANVDWTIKKITDMIEEGTMHYNSSSQRGKAWKNDKASKLVESVLMGYPIPPIYAMREETIIAEGKKPKKAHSILDGQQRTRHLALFVKDGFALEGIQPITVTLEDDTTVEYDINGLKFSELAEEMQNEILNRKIKCYYYDFLTDTEEKRLFAMLNNGQPLTAKNRALANCKDLTNLIDMKSNSILFEDMFTKKAIENKNHVSFIMKCWEMLNKDINDVSFVSKDFFNVLQNTIVTEDEEQRMCVVFDFATMVHAELVKNYGKEVAKKLYKETHFVSLVPFMDKAIENKIEPIKFAEFFNSFFGTEDNKTTINDDYNMNCVQGSAKNSSIVERNNILSAEFDKYFA